MRYTSNWLTALLILAGLVAPTAWAHPGNGVGGFAVGLAHPFAGIDHLLALLAVGVWAARQQGEARWVIPLFVLLAMAAGTQAAFAGLALPAVEPMIAASLVVLGLAVANGTRLPSSAGIGLASLFAFLHGHAHGSEAAGAAMGAYIGGMLLAGVALQGIGLWLGGVLRAPMLRWAGTGIAATGALLWVVGS